MNFKQSNLDKEEKAVHIYCSALCLSNHQQGVTLCLVFFYFCFLTQSFEKKPLLNLRIH